MGFSLEDILGAVEEVKRDLKDDPTIVQDLFKQDWSPTRIAQHVGIHRSTVYRRLEAAGLRENSHKPSAAARKDVCQRNHDMSVWGVENSRKRGGGRYCRMCKRLRERKGGINE